MLLILAAFAILSFQTVISAELDSFVSNLEDVEQWRVKRSAATSKNDEIIHRLRTFNKSFTLILHPDKSSFSKSHYFQFGNHDKQDMDFQKTLVAGKLLGRSDSYVQGSLVDGRFQGEISVDGIIYYIENAENFGKPKGPSKSSIAYRNEDVDLARGLTTRQRRSASEDFESCGWSHTNTQSGQRSHNHVHRREISASNMPDEARVCEIFLQVDHLLYQKFLQGANFDKNMAVINVMAYISFLVKGANRIFKGSEFSSIDGISAGPYKNIQIAVSKTKIYETEEQFSQAFNVKESESIGDDIEEQNFLNIISRQNYNEFCLSFVLTLRDFNNGVLGLAWIHHPSPEQRGGICDRYGEVSGIQQSMNSGFMTLLQYSHPVNRLVSLITFAHQLGHSFGAHHDNAPINGNVEDPTCHPGGEFGNYLMHSAARSGSKRNNLMFSHCSREVIAKNIKELENNENSFNCLKKGSVDLCGNKIVDPGEECDCGYGADCGEDAKCCGRADDPNAEMRCKLRGRAKCSLSNGACCDLRTCTFKPQSANYLCKEGTECLFPSFCNGKSAMCPESSKEADGKFCADLTKTCRDGECQVSSCEAISESPGFASCQNKRPVSSEGFNATSLCYLSCHSKTNTEICFSSFDANTNDFSRDFKKFLGKFNFGQPIPLLPGTPCDSNRGYCDASHTCQPITKGPISKLHDLISPENVTEFEISPKVVKGKRQENSGQTNQPKALVFAMKYLFWCFYRKLLL